MRGSKSENWLKKKREKIMALSEGLVWSVCHWVLNVCAFSAVKNLNMHVSLCKPMLIGDIYDIFVN